MTSADFLALLPAIITAATAVLILAAITIKRHHLAVLLLTLLGFAAALAAVALVWSPTPRAVTALLVVDGYALYFSAVLLIAGFIIALLAYGYLAMRAVPREEFYLLLATAVTGALVLAASRHFASFFLGVELVSVPLYALVAYQRDEPLRLEAGVKYLTMAGVASAFLLFGMALIYSDTGSMSFTEMANRLAAPTPLLGIGLGLLLAGAGFKLALVPFHLWVPDVYQGAPAPVSALIATISKGGIIAVLLRFLTVIWHEKSPTLLLALSILAVVTMLVGGLLGLRQTNIKRLLAYSSITNMGYVLVAFLVPWPDGMDATLFYVATYLVTTLGAFGIVAALSTPEGDADGEDTFRGLAWRRPWLAAVFTLMLLSLAGIPLTAGFMGKFYLLVAGVSADRWVPVVALVISSVLGLYYYLRVLALLFQHPADTTALPRVHVSTGLALALAAALVLLLGLHPGPLIDFIQEFANSL